MSGERQRVKKMCTGARGPGLETHLCHLEVGYLNSRRLSFFICKLRLIIEKKILIVSIEIIDL